MTAQGLKSVFSLRENAPLFTKTNERAGFSDFLQKYLSALT